MPKPPQTHPGHAAQQWYWETGNGYDRHDGPAVVLHADGACFMYWHEKGAYKGHVHTKPETSYIDLEGAIRPRL